MFTYPANDQSLARGGNFDITANFHTPPRWRTDGSHDEHRVGINCDVRLSDVPNENVVINGHTVSRRAVLEDIFRNNGSTRTGREFNLNHWHLRFEFNNHNVATVGSVPTPPSYVSRMKYSEFVIFFFGLVAIVGCSSSPRAQTKVQRQPLENQQREYKTPTNYDPRDRGYDAKTGKIITYDHKPRVELLDQKAGKYAFKWIGYDGKEKTAVFQRGDVIDVIVIAAVSKTSDGRYLYKYEAQNLTSSGTSLAGLAVQNFASDVKAVTPGGYAGQMSNRIFQFREGNWIRFGNSFFGKVFEPGEQLKVELASSAPPGVVECRAHGGESNLEGAGEEMPSALENLLPGYAEWPKGSTIGPVESLKALSLEQRIEYVLGRLPQFRMIGWMTDEAVARYEVQLKRNDLESVMNELDHDLQSEHITTEVHAIIQAIK